MVERILDWVERNFLKAVALSIFALVLLLCMVVYNVGNATGRASLEKRDYGRSLMPLIQSASRSLSRAALPVPPVEYGGYTPTIYAAPALKVEIPRQRTAAQMAAEMASAERAAVAKRRAVEAGVEAQRARVEIQKLQPELMQRRQQASYRVIEQLLRQA